MSVLLGQRGRGPVLFPLVYLASLSLIALSAVALAVLGREHVIQSTLHVAVEGDQATILDVVRSTFTAAELGSGTVEPDRTATIRAALTDLARRHGYLDVHVRSDRGLAIGSNGAGAADTGAPVDRTSALIVPATADGAGPLLVETIPVATGAGPQLVFEVRRDATAILARADGAWHDVAVVTGVAALVLVILLSAIFQAANVRLKRQHERLIESRRRDPLTDLLNHGALVTLLTERIETATDATTSFGIAIVDLDNFRLLNDVHGSGTGDDALFAVKDALLREAGPWEAVGRFGPDEFLVIAPDAVARDLPEAFKRVMADLRESWVQPAGSERLPITVSVAITYFPFHAATVTELLSAATVALGEAKAAGGDRVAIAGAWTGEPKTAYSTFDVLQGLVLAIDRKDRYTKLHSEDVAVYALFIADLLDLDEDIRTTLRVASLLHDVGKIGVPDDILRKPGRLTPYEYEVVKQHVALGDLIVRDLPGVEQVRAGVRYHHERWDGDGYLVGLTGDDIPLVARILAVGDAFSAMTTSRPYRKALGVETALAELRAASGTQLDPVLVDAFVTGMEADPAAPMPGDVRGSKALWARVQRAA